LSKADTDSLQVGRRDFLYGSGFREERLPKGKRWLLSQGRGKGPGDNERGGERGYALRTPALNGIAEKFGRLWSLPLPRELVRPFFQDALFGTMCLR
jgi:hypothetical protein